jgi:hypothetical protein
LQRHPTLPLSLHSEVMTPVDASDRRRSFCARLKSERERQGTSLAAIAASTKIKASLLEALERGDLSRWPKGLYRRAFFREYVAAIGMPPEPTISNFVELFTDGDAPRVSSAAAAPAAEPDSLRLLFAPEPSAPTATSTLLDAAARLGAAAVDICAVLALASIAAAVSTVHVAPVALCVGALFYVATTVTGVSPSFLLWTRVRSRHTTPVTSAAPPVAARPLSSDVQAPAIGAPAGLIVEALRSSRTTLHEYVERLSASEMMAGRQRRRDLASVRRQRVEAANRTTADELVM